MTKHILVLMKGLQLLRSTSYWTSTLSREFVSLLLENSDFPICLRGFYEILRLHSVHVDIIISCVFISFIMVLSYLVISFCLVWFYQVLQITPRPLRVYEIQQFHTVSSDITRSGNFIPFAVTVLHTDFSYGLLWIDEILQHLSLSCEAIIYCNSYRFL